MITKKFKDKEISMLAFGNMRLPHIEGSDSQIDFNEAERIIDFAYENGVNYYDTAWIYHGGKSEETVGKILSKYERSSFYLATKFPGYERENQDRVEEIFEEQLKRCRVDYFDFYLFHNVCDESVDVYLDESHGILKYLLKQKENGRIKHLGFSSHGSLETLEKFLKNYGKYMEFCQLQINYLDWFLQNAKQKVEIVKSYNIPIWVMEPVRGGKLAKLDENSEKILKGLRPDESIPAWGFRFLQGIPEIVTILSGMSSYEQVKDNLKTFESLKPLSDKELGELIKISSSMIENKIVPCTSCKYCKSHCPKNIDIPKVIDVYNNGKINGNKFEFNDVKDRPNDCIGCRSCEKVCPQTIKISEVMKEFAEKL